MPSSRVLPPKKHRELLRRNALRRENTRAKICADLGISLSTFRDYIKKAVKDG